MVSGGNRAAASLVLASASKARLRVLRDAGIEPTIRPSRVDEAALIASRGSVSTPELAIELAAAKARDVFAAPAYVLGADSIFEFEGERWGKAVDSAEVGRRWRRLRGKCGVLVTGQALIAPDGRMTTGSAVTRVCFGMVSAAEIAKYAATSEPLAAAGSFTMEGRAAAFLTAIQGDPSNVMGLSMSLLREMFANFGVSITEFWG